MTTRPRRKDSARGATALRTTLEPTAPEGPARLIVLEGDQMGRRFLVEGASVLGRDPAAAVVFDDADVSRHHARIERTVHGYVIEDLGSRNGTLVNGIPVEKSPLRFGDKIHVGPGVLLLFAQHDPVEEQILQRQRLEALGRLSAGVAHDFNNMLAAVAASADFLTALPESTPLSRPDVVETLADMKLAARRAGELTRGLLSFARGVGQSRARVDVGALCQEIAQLAKRTFDRSIAIETKAPPGLVVIGDRVELHQALMNLCVNAKDAMPSGGRLRLAVGRGAARGAGRAQVVVTVEDSGTGIGKELQRRIFEPFFTTKREGAGFGMGLATVLEVVRRHGGRVEVESEIGAGTIFRIALPAAGAESDTAVPATNPPAAARRASRRTRGRVLLVDDEDVVRRSTRRLLMQAGHEVVEVRSGRECVDVYQRAKDRPEVVVLDLDMPDLSGRETHAVLRQLDPDVKVIVVSGHDDDEVRRMAFADGVIGFVRKPYSGDMLLGLVERALEVPSRRSRRA